MTHDDTRPVVRATLLMSNRKQAITGRDENEAAVMHNGRAAMRAYCLGYDLPADDLADYVQASARTFTPDMIVATTLDELTSVVMGCIADAFLTGYHTRRFEEHDQDQEREAA